MSRHRGTLPTLPPPGAATLVLARVAALLHKLDRLLTQPVYDPATVHAIRVTIKKLRAWIRLLRHAGGRKLRRHDQALRTLARSFSAQRDADVHQQTLHWLQRRCKDPDLGRHLALFTAQQRAGTEQPPLPPLVLPPTIAPALLDQALSARALARSLTRSYTGMTRLADKAGRPGAGARQLHEWRKGVKYFGYQLGLTSTAKGSKHSHLQRELAALAKTLGLVQDLTVLRQYLKPLLADPATQQAAAAVRMLAAQERKTLATQARVLYTAMLIHAPGAPVSSQVLA